MNDSLQAEQQLGFPAGAAAGASSLDTAAPTVSILLESHIFHHICVGVQPVLAYPIPQLTAEPILHLVLKNFKIVAQSSDQLICSLCRCRAFQTQRQRLRQEGAVMTRMDRMAERRRIG